jgi:leucyl aminopeptidase
LSLKSKAGMFGMKHDMAGAAGLLGGFNAAIQLGLPQNSIVSDVWLKMPLVQWPLVTMTF